MNDIATKLITIAENQQKVYDAGYNKANENLEDFIEGSPASLSSSNIKTIVKSAFYNMPNLTSVNFPECTSIAANAFYGCTNLTSANFPNLQFIDKQGFYNCESITSLDLPKCTTVSYRAFDGCTNLMSLDFSLKVSFGDSIFHDCTSLLALILRYDGVCDITSKPALANTPIAAGTGYIYVPDYYRQDYDLATNWCDFSAQFRSLEDYTVDGTTTGALDPEKIGV